MWTSPRITPQGGTNMADEETKAVDLSTGNEFHEEDRFQYTKEDVTN